MTTQMMGSGRRTLRIESEIRGVMKKQWKEICARKAEGKPVVWFCSGLPRELLHVLEGPVQTIEHIGAAWIPSLAAKYWDVASRLGYSRDNCVAQVTIGCLLCEEKDPYIERMRLLRPPDLIVCSNFPCSAAWCTWRPLVQHYNCPYYFMDVPRYVARHVGEAPPDHAVKYVADQLRGLLGVLEEYGYKVDQERLRRVAERTREMVSLWNEIEQYMGAIPAPIAAADIARWVGPVSTAGSSDFAARLVREARDEVKERVENKIGVIDNERFRLIWLGWAPQFDYELMTYTEQYGAVVLTHEPSLMLARAGIDPEIIDPDRPLESLADVWIRWLPNFPVRFRIDYYMRLIKDWKIDGIIASGRRTCRGLPGAFRLIKDHPYIKEAGVPMTIIDYGDDPGDCDSVALKTGLDSFIEALVSRKAG